MSFLQRVRKRCREEVTPIPSLYNEELAGLRNDEWTDDSRELIQKIPPLYSTQASLYRERQKLLFALPVRREDINLEGPWRQTTSGENFVLKEVGQNDKIIIFVTSDNMRHLSAAETWYCNGTFHAAPSLFYQLYSVHAMVDGVMFPLVYALLPDKKESTYNKLFTVLREELLPYSVPSFVFMDFETAAINSVESFFPTTVVKGCYFHYSQCLWRKVQSIGLQNQYQSDPDVHRFVRKAASLPLVPVESVDDVWFGSLEFGPSHLDSVRRFADYVTEQWVEGLPRQCWNHYNNDGPRTTNHVEGWHSKLNKLVGHPQLGENEPYSLGGAVTDHDQVNPPDEGT